MMPRLSFAILLSIALLASPSQAGGVEPDLLTVGSTGIYCYQAPCPWRGISEPDSLDNPLWSGDVLPSVIASTEHRQRIARAWEAFDCVLIKGRFDGTALTVDDILGACS